MKKLSLFLLATALLTACNTTPTGEEASAADSQDQISQLKGEVMALHDKVMPEMTPMSKMQGQLMQASVGSADSIEYMTAATELKYAKDAMMKWMHDYSNTWDENWTEAEKMEFLKAEKDKMARIDELTEKAIAQGEAVLNKLETAPVQDSIVPAE